MTEWCQYVALCITHYKNRTALILKHLFVSLKGFTLTHTVTKAEKRCAARLSCATEIAGQSWVYKSTQDHAHPGPRAVSLSKRAFNLNCTAGWSQADPMVNWPSYGLSSPQPKHTYRLGNLILIFYLLNIYFKHRWVSYHVTTLTVLVHKTQQTFLTTNYINKNIERDSLNILAMFVIKFFRDGHVLILYVFSILANCNHSRMSITNPCS